MAGLHSNRGAKRAREAREALGLDPGAPLPCLLDVVEERAGLPVVVATLLEGLAGACVPFGTTQLLFVNGGEPRVRQRFTLAHELGHHWCGHDGGMVVDTIETVTGRATTPLEIEANAFAAEFLVPRAGLAPRFAGRADPTPDEILTVAAEYGTSGAMTHFRFRQLKLISDAGSEAFHAADHGEAWERLGLTGHPDRLAGLAQLPYLSPRLEGSHLGAAVRGDAAADPRLATAMARLLAPAA